MNRWRVHLHFTLASLALAVIAGCGGEDEGPPRYNLSGTVKYKGQPVPRGMILFRPDVAKGNSGPASEAEIVDGRYDTSKVGTGPVGGPHEVVILGYDGIAKPEEELPLGAPLFSQYTTTADLPKSEQGATLDFEVTP
jgi:hypothetical protein